MFNYNLKLTSFDPKVSKLAKIDGLTNFNTRNLTNMYTMFVGVFTELDLSHFNIDKVRKVEAKLNHE